MLLANSHIERFLLSTYIVAGTAIFIALGCIAVLPFVVFTFLCAIFSLQWLLVLLCCICIYLTIHKASLVNEDSVPCSLWRLHVHIRRPPIKELVTSTLSLVLIWRSCAVSSTKFVHKTWAPQWSMAVMMTTIPMSMIGIFMNSTMTPMINSLYSITLSLRKMMSAGTACFTKLLYIQMQQQQVNISL